IHALLQLTGSEVRLAFRETPLQLKSRGSGRFRSALLRVLGVSALSFNLGVSPGRPVYSSEVLGNKRQITTFRINTCKSVSKQRTLSPFRINTYEKQGEVGLTTRCKRLALGAQEQKRKPH